MPKYLIITSFILTLFVTGCLENEETFYIEHAKATADPPDCTYATGDNFQYIFSIDLTVAHMAETFFYVTNAAMIKEDYENITSETAGIFVDGVNVQTIVPGIGAVGSTEYYETNYFISPETSDIVFGYLATTSAMDRLRDYYQCPNLNSQSNIKTIVNAIIDHDEDVINNFYSAESSTQSHHAYSTVKYIGHTQGGRDVETPEFTTSLSLYCGPSGGWSPCFNGTLCEAFCTEPIEESCERGVNDHVTCHDILYGKLGSWMEWQTIANPDGGTQDVMVEMNCENCS